LKISLWSLTVIILFVLLLIPAISAYSQVRLGIRGGANATRLSTTGTIETDDFKITYPDYSLLGFHAGLVSQIQIFNMFIQPELLYTFARNDIKIFDLNSSNPEESETIEQKLNRIDAPIMVGIKFGAFKIQAGPIISFLLSEDSRLSDITSYDLQLSKATIGYQAGIGIDAGKLAFDVKYEGNLSKFGTGINIGNSEMAFDQRVNQLVASVGIFF